MVPGDGELEKMMYGARRKRSRRSRKDDASEKSEASEQGDEEGKEDNEEDKTAEQGTIAGVPLVWIAAACISIVVIFAIIHLISPEQAPALEDASHSESTRAIAAPVQQGAARTQPAMLPRPPPSTPQVKPPSSAPAPSPAPSPSLAPATHHTDSMFKPFQSA